MGVAAYGGCGAAHAAKGAALEALGLVTGAHAAYAESARLEPSHAAHGASAARLLPLRRLFAVLAAAAAGDGGGSGGSGGSGGGGGGSGGADTAAAVPVAEEEMAVAAEESAATMTPLTAAQAQLVERLRHVISEHSLAAHLLPLPTPERVLADDRFNSAPHRLRQQRLMALIGVDAAAAAACAANGGHNASEAVRQWLLLKAAELGLDVTNELVRAAVGEEDEDGGDCDGGNGGSETSDDDDDDSSEEADGPMANEEVDADGTYGRVLVQFELAPHRQRLTLSLVSLNAADLGEPVLKYCFAVGLTSAYLLEAESKHQPYFEFAEWSSAERGAFTLPEGLPPAASVERRAKAFVDFFSRGEGALSPIAPHVASGG